MNINQSRRTSYLYEGLEFLSFILLPQPLRKTPLTSTLKGALSGPVAPFLESK